MNMCLVVLCSDVNVTLNGERIYDSVCRIQ